MAENFIFIYQKKEKKIEDSIVDYGELQDKFISSFGLTEDIKNDLKFFINGKEITKDDELMDIIKQDDIIEVKNTKEKDNEVEENEEEEKPKEQEDCTIEKVKIEESNSLNESNKEELTKYMNDILKEKLEENNEKLEKLISEKNDEKLENIKTELKEIIEEKIENIFTKNDLNQKILNIENKLSQLNQDYTDFKSVKIKYFNKFIEFLENKSGPQDSIKQESNESSQKNEDIEKLKENNNKLKELIKKYKKEKDELKDKLEKELANKGNSGDDSKKIEKLKKENENLLSENQKLNDEKKNLNDKIKKLENEIKKKSDKNALKSSISKDFNKNVPKKYNCKINPEKSENTYEYEKVKENKLIEFNLKIKNEGKEELPKNCEIKLINDIIGLSSEKCRTKNALKNAEEMETKMTLKVDNLESLKLNENICVQLKLLDDKKKEIEGAACTLNIKIEKEEESPNVEESSQERIILEENEYQELFDHINDALNIESIGQNISTFKEKILELVEDKKDKYDGITVRTEYIESLKEDLEEIFQ